MTESEAKRMIQAHLDCEERESAVIYDYQCDKDCDACELNYAQGTVGEHREALQMAINALEKVEKIKSVVTDKRKQYRQGWEEIEQIVKEREAE